jgi:hypothetical protein
MTRRYKESVDEGLIPVKLTRQEIDRVFERRVEDLRAIEAIVSGSFGGAGAREYCIAHHRIGQIQDLATPSLVERLRCEFEKFSQEYRESE